MVNRTRSAVSTDDLSTFLSQVGRFNGEIKLQVEASKGLEFIRANKNRYSACESYGVCALHCMVSWYGEIITVQNESL